MKRSIPLLLPLLLVASLMMVGYAWARPAEPAFVDLRPAQEQRLLERVGDSPAPYRRLLRKSYSRTRIRASSEFVNGSYVLNKGAGDNRRFVVFLDVMTRRAGEYGDHLTLHELGHVIDNGFFDAADDERFLDLFRTSPKWRECFETPEGSAAPCVPEQEVLADQLAFYATGKLRFRSSYDVPPLASRAAMGEAIRAGA